jgi:hypothetical protein
VTLYETVTLDLRTGKRTYKNPVEVTEDEFEKILQPLAEILKEVIDERNNNKRTSPIKCTTASKYVV